MSSKCQVRHADFGRECYRCSTWVPTPITCKRCRTCKTHCTCPPVTLEHVVFLALLPIAWVMVQPVKFVWWAVKKVGSRS